MFQNRSNDVLTNQVIFGHFWHTWDSSVGILIFTDKSRICKHKQKSGISFKLNQT